MKKVLLVFPDISERSWHKGYFHYGLAHISSYLKQSVGDVEVSLLPVRDRNFGQADFNERIKEFSPEVVGFTSTTHSFPLVQRMLGWTKKLDKNILTVCGGIHVTINPEEALLSSESDVVVCGDGEYPMEALVNEWHEHSRIADIRGAWHRKNGTIVNAGVASVADLDLLPDPDWEIFDYMNLDEGSQGIGGLMLSRGCPYQCSYCCNHKIANIYKANKTDYIRFKSVEKSISEIKSFVNKFPAIHTLYFDDDILPLKRQWFLDFAKRYKNEINKPYWCNVRPNLVDEEIVEAFVTSGCVRAGIGIESGNDNIRNEILKRNISEETLINAVSLLKKRKIYVYSFNMVGIPQETKEELLDTIRLNARLDIDKMQCSVFYPYKHTALYDFVVREGIVIDTRSLIEYTHESILKFGFAQKNRIYFTVLTINLVAKIYRMMPGYLSEPFLRMLYSAPSALLLLPFVNFLMRKILKSKKVTVNIRKIFRMLIPPPPTALTAGRSKEQTE
jgi:radical SAM superfamily enzyme YgiQ (UPF0313 family)